MNLLDDSNPLTTELYDFIAGGTITAVVSVWCLAVSACDESDVSFELPRNVSFNACEPTWLLNKTRAGSMSKYSINFIFVRYACFLRAQK